MAVSVNPNHGEALNNIAVLEMRRQKFDVAKSCLSSSCSVSNHLFEPLFNSGKKVMCMLRLYLFHPPFPSTYVLPHG